MLLFLPQRDRISFEVTLASPRHSISDARFVFDAVDGLVTGCIYAAISCEEFPDENVARARHVVLEALEDPKAGSRFYPDLFMGFHARPDKEAQEGIPPLVDIPDYQPLHPLDAGVRDGLNSFLRRAIQRHDVKLYEALFNIAAVHRVEHHSPLVLEVVLPLGAACLATAALVYGSMRAAVGFRRQIAEAQIRETEALIRQEELLQKRLQTQILEHIVDGVRELNAEQIPKEAITAAATVNTTPIADLGTNPVIGNLTIGASASSD